MVLLASKFRLAFCTLKRCVDFSRTGGRQSVSVHYPGQIQNSMIINKQIWFSR